MGIKKNKVNVIDSSNFGKYYLTIGNKKYCLDIDQLRKVCINPNDEEIENEITTTYEADNGGELAIAGKLIREVKSANNQQNQMIIYDVVKLFITRLLNNTQINNTSDPFLMDFSTALSLNTLIKCGIIIEINE